MLELLKEWDKELLLLINGWNSPLFDSIMFFISKKTVWIPLYAFLLYEIFRNYGKKAWLILLFAAFLITLTDQTSSAVMKNVFQRLRPCHDPSLNGFIHLVNGHCGGRYGFVSSHATNSFAVAIFTGVLLRKKYNFLLPVLIFWAAVVSYSRIYLGVHYPADVLAGTFLGSGLGIMTLLLYQQISNLLTPNNKR